MNIGVFARTFARDSLEGVIDAICAYGLHETQWNMLCAGIPSMPEWADLSLARRIRDASQRKGLQISAVSGTFNMIHPDPKVRKDGLRRLGILAEMCREMGVSTVTVCTGTRHTEDLWCAHPDNSTFAAWNDLLVSMEAALALTSSSGVALAFECEPANVVDTSKRGRQLLREMNSPRLKVVMDAANLIRPADATSFADRLAEAFDDLGDHIVLAHAKDVVVSQGVHYVPAGQGCLPYGSYIRHLREIGYNGALVMHQLEEADVSSTVAFLKEQLGPDTSS